jgi:hypothetical protein
MRLNELLDRDMLDEEISRPEIRKIEQEVDPEYDDFDIDVDLGSRHFIDRVNDRRNSPSIKPDEIEDTFLDTLAQNEDEFDQMRAGDEAVLHDAESALNIPVVFKGQGSIGGNTGREDLTMTAKTIMRKPNFTSPDRKISSR